MLDNLNSNGQLGKWLMVFTATILVAYPITRFVYLTLHSIYLTPLVSLSIVAIAYRWSDLVDIKLERMDKLLLLSFFLIFAVTLLSFYVYGEGHGAAKRVRTYSGFIYAIPVYFLFRMYMPSSRVIWGALIVASYVVAARAWLEMNGYVDELIYKYASYNRANGTMHPIRFGDLTMLMGFISLAGSLYIENTKNWMKYSGYLAFLCGLYASAMSQSRGAWIAVPALLFIVLWPVFKKLQVKSKMIFLLSIVIGLVVVFNLPGLKIEKRFDFAISDVKQYFEYDNSDTSIGARFDMYETAYWMFAQKPLFGVGLSNYNTNSDNYYKLHKDRMSSMAADRNNPHNEILMHMATRGLVGLAVLLMLFTVGTTLFVSHMRRYDSKTLFYAVSGLMIFVAYMHYGMSIALFKHRDFTLFFVVYVLLFAAGVHKETIKSEASS